MWYNIEYTAPDGPRLYCIDSMSLPEADLVLKKFKDRYLNSDGTGKAYPNGKGFYPFCNPRVVPVED